MQQGEMIYAVYCKTREETTADGVPCDVEVWSLKSGFNIEDLSQRIGPGVKRLLVSFCPHTAVAEHLWRSRELHVGIADPQVDCIVDTMRKIDWSCPENCEHPRPVAHSIPTAVASERKEEAEFGSQSAAAF